jgi:hypothetical protein
MELADPLAHWFPGCKREFVMDDTEDNETFGTLDDPFKRNRIH